MALSWRRCATKASAWCPRRAAPYATWEEELRKAADLEPEYIIDDGAELTMRVDIHRPDVFARLKGVSEETTTSTARLYALEAAGKLPFPTLTANDARCKHLFDNRYGTGQTTLQAVLRLTNRMIAGAQIVVVGYGYVRRGIAEYATAMHAQVRVIEVDPVRALEAYMDGHRVGTAADILPGAQFVITATGGMRAIGAPEFAHLDDGTVLANAGHHDLEVDVAALVEMASAQDAREGIMTYGLDTRDVHVLSNGALVNIVSGSGHPVEIMVLTFAERLRGIGADVCILDDNSDLAAHKPSYVLGASHTMPKGHLGATTQVLQIVQSIPVVDLSRSPLMGLAHDHIGIGQASVMALLDITNLQLAGRRVVVCGYGATGQEVAAQVAALGVRVTVVETDPLCAFQALFAGHHVEGFATALPSTEVLFATDNGPQVGMEQINHLPSGITLCAAGVQALF